MRVVAKGTSAPDNHFKLALTFQILVYFCYFLFGQWEPEKKKKKKVVIANILFFKKVT